MADLAANKPLMYSGEQILIRIGHKRMARDMHDLAHQSSSAEIYLQIMEAVHIKQALKKKILLDRKDEEVHINSRNRKLEYFAPKVSFVKE